MQEMEQEIVIFSHIPIEEKDTLETYLYRCGVGKIEGTIYQCPEQMELLKNIVIGNTVTNIMEIGFNAGHSADLFLSIHPGITLVSFELMPHLYSYIGVWYIKARYPNRFTIIQGNSIWKVPRYANEMGKKFDLIFIDGGHDYPTAKTDLINCRKLAHKDTIVVMDDTHLTTEKGTRMAWDEAKKGGFIIEIGDKDFGEKYKNICGKGMSWGKYKEGL